MKNLLKKLPRKNNLLIFLIFFVAIFVRFYNFGNRAIFWSEQARSLIVSAEYLKKFSFLGQEYFRQDTSAHKIFSGALFNYSLVPLLFIGNWDPVVITSFFALLNVVTGFAIFLIVKKIFGVPLAAISSLLFLFNDFMIYHSLFIWNYNYLPLIGILVFYYLWRNFRDAKLKYGFILGLICGTGISLQVLFVFYATLVLIFVIWNSKTKVKGFMVFVLGILAGNLPMVIFDLRHNFYETRTLWQFFLDTTAGKSDAGFAYYYLLPLWPLFAILLAFIIMEIFEKNKLVGVLVLGLYLFFNLTSPKISWNGSTGMPRGLNVKDVDVASAKIAADALVPFNVSEVLDFDKRAYVFRYFLTYKYRKPPLGETQYENLKLLYVLGEVGYNFGKSDVWEVAAGSPYKIGILSRVGEGYAIYRLQK